MKFVILAAAFACLSPAAALAQTAPAPAAAAAAPVAAKFNLDTPIETLMADAAAKAVLAKYNLHPDQHPAYDQFSMLSLRAVQPMSQGMITEEMLPKIEADLATIK